MTKVLEGIRVLDFGRVIASAYCGTLLADMGAEVIKVERPGGEFDRKLGPFTPGGQAIVYELINPCNKKSITLNIRHPKGKEILDELVRNSSIIISGFTPKGNQLMGLNYERLEKIDPAVILVAISGYGQNGPYADRPAFDAIAQAESGAMSYTGFPGGPPARSAVPFADFGTAILGAYGAMLALFHKERTGVGQLVDVSLMDTAFAFVAGMGVIAEYTLLNQIRPQVGNNSFYNYTDSFEAKDGWVVISAIGDEIWQRFTAVIKREDLLDDDRFRSDYNRFVNRHLIRPIVGDWVAERTISEVIGLLEKNRVPCGRVNTARELINDPHLIAREMLVNRHYPGVGTVPLPGVPVKLSETPGKIETNAPHLGEHNKEIYCNMLHYSQKDLDSMRREGVI
ncbi:MAG: CoA transferase [Deltaproteobacteria bacterium]|nr:CoA transferase [Deltaproteobacteria bacterium]